MTRSNSFFAFLVFSMFNAMNIINRIMPILKNWFSKTDKKKVDDFIRIIYQYITSRTPLSGKFVIAKG